MGQLHASLLPRISAVLGCLHAFVVVSQRRAWRCDDGCGRHNADDLNAINARFDAQLEKLKVLFKI